MICPFCKSNCTRVIDKRESGTTATRRRRECEQCKKRFTTYERVENVILNILKRDGRIQEFDREKLKRGIAKATSKRHISDEVIDDIISEIEQRLLGNDKQIIKSSEIGEMVLKKLTKIDKLSALLFAAVYKEFQRLEDVQSELARLESLT
jgi:transcriptional repressor NrdR